MSDLTDGGLARDIDHAARPMSRFAFLRPDSVAPTWIGIAAVGLGFALIAYTWAKVAGLTSVALQLPYFVSGGLTALGLILVGITVINIAAKRRDAAERDRQTEQLAATMAELRAALGGNESGRRSA